MLINKPIARYYVTRFKAALIKIDLLYQNWWMQIRLCDDWIETSQIIKRFFVIFCEADFYLATEAVAEETWAWDFNDPHCLNSVSENTGIKALKTFIYL